MARPPLDGAAGRCVPGATQPGDPRMWDTNGPRAVVSPAGPATAGHGLATAGHGLATAGHGLAIAGHGLAIAGHSRPPPTY
jgi:hypothetical protein